MLTNCVITWLYIHVLTLTWENLISVKFSSVFLVFQCGASGRSLLAFGRVEFSGLDVTFLESGPGRSFVVRMRLALRPNALDQPAPFWGSARPDVIKTPSEWGLHRGYKSPLLAALSPYPTNLTFCCLRVSFFLGFWIVCPDPGCPFAYSSHIPGIPLVLFLSVYFTTVRIFFLECFWDAYICHAEIIWTKLCYSLNLFLQKSVSLLLFFKIFVTLTRIFFLCGLFLAKFLLVLL